MAESGLELYRLHRPQSFKQILGQPEVVATLERLLKTGKMPHCLLMVGPSGVGKTTIARILKSKLNCGDPDYTEVNCAAVESPMDTVRSIQNRMHLAPIAGDCRIWLYDEIQSLSRTTFAQQALLKMLEDTPSHCYFFLCTTDPSKIIETIRTRCVQVKLRSLSVSEIQQLLAEVTIKEQATVSKQVLQKIAELANGSARQALQSLHKVIGLDSEEEQLNAVQSIDAETKGIDIARALLNPKSKWPDIARLINQVEEEPETIRRIILGYASKVLLGGGNMSSRAYLILCQFENNWFDSAKSGLVRAAYEVFSHEK